MAILCLYTLSKSCDFFGSQFLKIIRWCDRLFLFKKSKSSVIFYLINATPVWPCQEPRTNRLKVPFGGKVAAARFIAISRTQFKRRLIVARWCARLIALLRLRHWTKPPRRMHITPTFYALVMHSSANMAYLSLMGSTLHVSPVFTNSLSWSFLRLSLQAIRHPFDVRT